jgi:hypothetical protein
MVAVGSCKSPTAVAAPTLLYCRGAEATPAGAAAAVLAACAFDLYANRGHVTMTNKLTTVFNQNQQTQSSTTVTTKHWLDYKVV